MGRMKNNFTHSSETPSTGILILGWVALLFIAYGRLLLHPDLHTACPENDTWNLPIRWSVFTTLQKGYLPLWNPLSAFGIPWLATWQTETFYPGTFLFKWFGLSAWNYSGLLHLLIFSVGIYVFLRKSNVKSFWSFMIAAIALMNGCAYNHLGSNSSMDTMAWMPWLLLATRARLNHEFYGGLLFALFLVLQIFAGYPQIILYTLIGCFAYGVFLKGWRPLIHLALPLGIGLLLSAAQWIPSVEYFFLNCVRLPAVHDNPYFYLPSENLKTFFDFNALWKGGTPDYVLSPTFFYFNFSSGIIPLIILALGFFRFKKLTSLSRFFLIGFLFLVLWALGYPLTALDSVHIPIPGFLEPAKSWVLINVFELLTLGLLLQDLFPKPGKWKWAVFASILLNLLIPVWNHPFERNLTINDPEYLEDSIKMHDHLLRHGHVLILPSAVEHSALYTPLPDPQKKPHFKHFIPNSNLYDSFPVATFYGSTQPTWGAYDAGLYFQYGFPYSSGTLIDLLNIDLLYLPESTMPDRFKKISTDDSWTLWENPNSVGPYFFFNGIPQTAARKDAFAAFANGSAKPLENLFLDPTPVSLAPKRFEKDWYGPQRRGALIYPFEGHSDSYLVITQNATPGWRAWINCTPSPIYLADGIFQCVPIHADPKRTFSVWLSYEPASFRFGLFISLLSFAILIWMAGLKKLGGINL